MNQWDADVVLTSDMAILLIEKQFSRLSPVRLTLFGEGWDNSAFLVNNKYVFRFPRRKIAAELLEQENNILPLIAGHLPAAIPVPIFTGKPSEDFPYPFSGYSIIPGITACRAGLTENQRIKLAEPLALFLKSLHSIPVERVGNAWPDKIGRLNLNKRIPMLYDYLEKVSLKIEINKKEIIKIAEAIPEKMEEGKSALVHGDFYIRHILVDDNRNLAGIIDWGDLHIGNPAVDLSVIHTFFPPEARKIFLEVYGEIDDNTWLLSRFRGLYMALLLTHYGLEIGDEFLVKEGEISMKYISLIDK
jgi:aminoglycoside phosphotransferase (APT) family kinase protein